MATGPRPLEADGRVIKTRERYIDLFLEEEILCNPDFARWFGERLGVEGATALDAEASFRLHQGETDLVVLLLDRHDRRHLVHVENKVDTVLSRSQAERYRPRTRAHATLMGIASSFTCLVAPARHGGRFLARSTMDEVITYEEILQRFSEQDGERARYRTRKLEAAIEHANYPVLCNLTPEEIRLRRIEQAMRTQRKRRRQGGAAEPQTAQNLEMAFDTAA